MTRPKLGDLYCCEGGASEGYSRAGWDVVGVDLFEDYTQKRYPFPSVKSDALAFLRDAHPNIDAWHASPPCQRHTAGTRAISRDRYPDLIGPTRALLRATGKPYVVENVPGAPLEDPIVLCGTMFGLAAYDEDGTRLELWRHRLFESNVPLYPPTPCAHGWFSPQVAGVYGGARGDKDEARNVRHGGYVPRSKRVQEDLLGIDWMTQRGRYQALPPVYTEHIGRVLMRHLEREMAA